MLEFIALAAAVVALYRTHSLSREVRGLRQALRDGQAARPEAAPERHEAAEGAPAKPPVRKSPKWHPRLWRRAAKSTEPLRVPTPLQRVSWMVWVGGVSVALAGVFMVRYAIDQGLLTPWARIGVATAAGLGMHLVAEWLYRRTGQRHAALSALAGGGSITLASAGLAALHLYELVPAWATFVFVAAVFMATLALALRHGPVLAVLGLVGAYTVPMLVGGESGRIVGVLVYALIVSAAVLLLIRYRDRLWLWGGMLAGAMLWWLGSIGPSEADGFRGPYLGLLGLAILVLPSLDWRKGLSAALRSAVAIAVERPSATRVERISGLRVLTSFLVLILAQAVSIATEPFTLASALGWTPLVALAFIAGRRWSQCAALPWISLIVQSAAWIGHNLEADGPRLAWTDPASEVQKLLPAVAALTAALYVLLAWWNTRIREPAALWASLTALAPACWLGVGFLVATGRDPMVLWAAAGGGLAILHASVAFVLERRSRNEMASWMVVGYVACISVGLAILLRDAGLTLALAVQCVPVVWLAVRYGRPNIAWLVKVMLGIAVIRLTLNPWVTAYDSGEYWVLWTYGGSALACVVAGQVARPLRQLRRWVEACAAHLVVLACWAVTRDWLYEGDLLANSYSLTEGAINTSLWAALGLVYWWRSGASTHLGGVYRWLSRILLAMSLASYLHVLFPLNPVWRPDAVGATPVWNLLLLAYGAPALLAVLVSRLGEPALRRLSGWVAAVAAFSFVTLEIRHLWRGTLDWSIAGTDGEMATYSIAWLVMAVAAILAGWTRFGVEVYRGGLILLLFTVCKVFLVDMSGLTGLLRAGSFLGLGLCLLALAYLHQRLGGGGSAGDRVEPPTGEEDAVSGAGRSVPPG